MRRWSKVVRNMQPVGMSPGSGEVHKLARVCTKKDTCMCVCEAL